MDTTPKLPNPLFSESALLLIGHGSTVNPGSAAPVYQHAATLRRRQIFAEVREAFWKVPPKIAEVLPQLRAGRIFIVPLFISEGYFTQQAIPRELGLLPQTKSNFPRVQQRSHQTLYYGSPVGTHPSMTGLVLARAREVVAQYPFPRAAKPAETTLFIAGHGTLQDQNSRKAIEHQVEAIRKMQLYAEVYPLFLEEEPRIADWHLLAGARNVVVVPFFISEGLHAQEEIPVLLGERPDIVRQRLQLGQPGWRNPTERKGKLVWYSSSIGQEPGLADIILERAAEIADLAPVTN